MRVETARIVSKHEKCVLYQLVIQLLSYIENRYLVFLALVRSIMFGYY